LLKKPKLTTALRLREEGCRVLATHDFIEKDKNWAELIEPSRLAEHFKPSHAPKDIALMDYVYGHTYNPTLVDVLNDMIKRIRLLEVTYSQNEKDKSFNASARGKNQSVGLEVHVRLGFFSQISL